MLVIAPIPTIFPLVNLLFLKEYRNASWQVLICRIWTRNQRQAKAAAERSALENIDEDLVSAARNKHRNKNMKNVEHPVAPITSSQLSVASSVGGVSYNGECANVHRNSTTNIGKQVLFSGYLVT